MGNVTVQREIRKNHTPATRKISGLDKERRREEGRREITSYKLSCQDPD